MQDTVLVKFKAGQLWNSLPERLQHLRQFDVFKRPLKEYLLDNIDSC